MATRLNTFFSNLSHSQYIRPLCGVQQAECKCVGGCRRVAAEVVKNRYVVGSRCVSQDLSVAIFDQCLARRLGCVCFWDSIYGLILVAFSKSSHLLQHRADGCCGLNVHRYRLHAASTLQFCSQKQLVASVACRGFTDWKYRTLTARTARDNSLTAMTGQLDSTGEQPQVLDLLETSW